MIHQILPGGSVDVAMAAEGNLEIVLKEGLKCGWSIDSEAVGVMLLLLLSSTTGVVWTE